MPRCIQALITFVIAGVAVAGSSPATTLVRPRHRHIRYTGRFDFSARRSVRFDWPGSQIRAVFEGGSCRALLSGHGYRLGVYIDDSLHRVVLLDSSTQLYTLAEGLCDTVHTLLIVNRFESFTAPARFDGLMLEKGKKLRTLPPAPARQLEFVGGSLLTGFGVESHSIACESVPDSSNAHSGFGPVAARMLDAEYSLVAISGWGLCREWASPVLAFSRAFGSFYARTLKNRPRSRYHASSWNPNAVVIAVGTSDFSSPPHAPHEVFKARYKSLIRTLRARHGVVPIVCVVSRAEPLRSCVAEVVAEMRDEADSCIHILCYPPIPRSQRGCGWHPNAEGHRRIAETLVNFLRPLFDE